MKDKRQLQVMEASLKLFLHYGYQKVSLVDIARDLGVSRPTVYQAFPNKEEIFKALVEQRNEEALNRIEEICRGSAKPEKKLFHAMEIWLIEPFEMVSSAPGENDLQGATFDFAEDVIASGYATFAEKCKGILTESKVDSPVSSSEVANLISKSSRGFKLVAEDVEDLRKLILNLISLLVGKQVNLS